MKKVFLNVIKVVVIVFFGMVFLVVCNNDKLKDFEEVVEK